MGQRASDTRGITFEDVVIPKEVRCVSCYMKLYFCGSYKLPFCKAKWE